MRTLRDAWIQCQEELVEISLTVIVAKVLEDAYNISVSTQTFSEPMSQEQLVHILREMPLECHCRSGLWLEIKDG